MASTERERLYATANLLAVLTIFYNLVEGLVSVWLGASDETLVLFGFGIDSFIEVVSAVGVWHMLGRVRTSGEERRDEFERTALRVTGGAFYALTAGLLLMAGLNLYAGHRPETTLWGIVVSLVSLSFMWGLIHYKIKVGRALGSAAILADAACSRACLYLSLVLLAASAGYEATGLAGLDSAGAAVLAWLSWREGREAFGKARELSCGCSCGG